MGGGSGSALGGFLGAAAGIGLVVASGGTAAPLVAGGLMGAGMGMAAGSSFDQASAIEDQDDWYRTQRELEIYQANMQAVQSFRAAEIAAMAMRAQLAEADAQTAAAERDAVMIKTQAKTQAHQLKRESSQIGGTQTANYAKAGVLMEGTPELMRQERQRLTADDIANILNAGDHQALNAYMQGGIRALQSYAAATNSAGDAAGLYDQANQYRLAQRNINSRGALEDYNLKQQAWASRVNGISSTLTGLGTMGMKLYSPGGDDGTAKILAYDQDNAHIQAGWK